MDPSSSNGASAAVPHLPVPRLGCTPARVLLALGGERSAVRALREAHSFARAVRAELHVLRVVPHVHGPTSGGPLSLARALRESHRVVLAGRHTREFCDRVLGERLPSKRIGIRLGAFMTQVAERAAELQADVIALASNRPRLGTVAPRLALRTGCRVLVARGRRSAYSMLLAATDLEDEQTPVLRHAARLGRDLNATVVALHGVVDPSSALSSVSLDRRRSALERAALELGSSIRPLMLSAANSAQCILEGAQSNAADLIILGARHRSHAPSTAERVLEQTRRSVLVAPIEARGPRSGRSFLGF